MEGITSLDSFNLWKKEQLMVFLRARGLPTTGKVAELRALAYSASIMDVPIKESAEEANASRFVYDFVLPLLTRRLMEYHAVLSNKLVAVE
jgi:hypothetical protein